MVSVENKRWGKTSLLFSTPSASFHALECVEGCSSIHRHLHKFNHFYVVSGCIAVSVYTDEREQERTSFLRAGEHTMVDPGVWHQFTVVEPGTMTEWYTPDNGHSVDVRDIERVPGS